MKILAIVAILGALPPQATELAKAEKVLVDRPDDPAANTTIGAYYAGSADWGRALPYLGKSKAPEIVTGVEAEKKDDGNYLTWVEIADAWTKKLPKSGSVRQTCIDRANYWYLRAWPNLDEVWRMKLRERLARLYAPSAPGRATGFQEGWSGPADPAQKAFLTAERVHSGGTAMKLVPSKKAKNARLLFTPSVEVKPGKKVEFSLWILTDGTGSVDDHVRFYIDGQVGAKAIVKDCPIWQRIAFETEAGEGTIKANIEVVLFSTFGVAYVDDVSIKVDGKEGLQGGGFEK